MFGWDISNIGFLRPEPRTTGRTESERFLSQICQKTFLSLWSFPNPYTDRGKSLKNENGKELCDLLVVFGKHVIIFSDKSCSFPDTGNLDLDWSRWFKRAIKKSSDQLYGAERWILDHPDRIFSDPNCSKRLPLQLPPPNQIIFHRIVIALGAKSRAESHFGSGSNGSLILNNYIKDEDHIKNEFQLYCPFSVGIINSKKGFVHVFDDITTSLIINELDTISDFVEYLSEKEMLFKRDVPLCVCGEENLLGFYMRHRHEGGFNSFFSGELGKIARDCSIVIPENEWESYKATSISHIIDALKEKSKFWDELIEHVTQCIFDGSINNIQEDNLQYHEQNLRFLAQEPRLSRAQLSQAIQYKISTTPRDKRSGMVLSSSNKSIGFVFLVCPRIINGRFVEDYDEYREERRKALEIYCVVAKSKSKIFKYIVGIAVDPLNSGGRSEDIMTFDFTDWNADQEKQAKKISKIHGILSTHRTVGFGDMYRKEIEKEWQKSTLGESYNSMTRAQRRSLKARARKKKKFT
ncbi:hypothetical protein [Azospirillum sp. B2RO_4]|uniref:hypothetical protein n=1 Tax=Azospirillum sp. B2RO_4 TaxID=3027796 RepID=UPI003DA9C8B9